MTNHNNSGILNRSIHPWTVSKDGTYLGSFSNAPLAASVAIDRKAEVSHPQLGPVDPSQIGALAAMNAIQSDGSNEVSKVYGEWLEWQKRKGRLKP